MKHYLEQLGFQVLLSEKNDFPKPLDKNTLDACLQVIEQADYYVLLIGARVGQIFDDGKGLSITRAEYRHAYQLMQAGKIHLAVFVRHDLWTIRQDRKALSEYLSADEALQKELSEDVLKSIANHPSPVLNDAEKIFDFLQEVTREEESRRAATGEGTPPPGNWVHSFSTFEEIIEALQTEFHISHSLQHIALKANLRRELLTNLTWLTCREGGKLYPKADLFLTKARQFLSETVAGTSVLPAEQVENVGRYSLLASDGINLSADFIDQAVNSGEFLDFDSDQGVYVDTSFNQNLVLLSRLIRGHKELLNRSGDQLTQILATYGDLSKSRETSLPNLQLVFPFGIANSEHNIVAVSVALVKALDGDPQSLANLNLLPTSPFARDAEEINRERISVNEVETWIKAPLV